jgi:catechol 2,3-dioxygenase-like lactoylglutathione lyase family enzyme
VIDHLGLAVADWARSKAFYTAARAPSGDSLTTEIDAAVTGQGAALHVGGRDNGALGLRPHDPPHDFSAFVLDPDGHNIEAACPLPA